jgi:hypothetical protein
MCEAAIGVLRNSLRPEAFKFSPKLVRFSQDAALDAALVAFSMGHIYPALGILDGVRNGLAFQFR